MPPVIDLKGQHFGRWLVIRRSKGLQQARWNCKCTCGVIRDVDSKSLSCGCIRSEKLSHDNHQTTHGYSHTPTYHVWNSMRQRCTNPSVKCWHSYGGATPPVCVCPEWCTFEGFVASMGLRPSSKHSLGRILDIGNYAPGNVFWMTSSEQNLAQKNKRALLHWYYSLPIAAGGR